MLVRVLTLMLCLTTFSMNCGAQPELMLVGIDEKTTFTDGKTVQSAPGNDHVLVVDISNREAPRIIADLDLMNSVYGPPTNLIITPDQKLGLVASSMVNVQKDGVWTNTPDNKLHLINLEGKPKLIGSIEVGKTPSGLDLTPDGKLLLIGNRGEPSITVVRIEGKTAKVVGTVTTDNTVDTVSITPDGKRALFIMRAIHTAGILHIDGENVTYSAAENIPVGVAPYNCMVSPKGDIAIVNSTGSSTGNDGSADPVTIIDLTAEHPHVIDWVTVGDGPEGLMFSPAGELAVATLIRGTQNAVLNPGTAWAAHEKGLIAIMSIEGKTVRKVQEVEVGGMPEGVVFSADTKYLYIGNFLNDNIQVFRIENGKVVDTGKTLALPGAPASMRAKD